MRTLTRGLGQLLITLGVVVLLFGVYEFVGTGVYTRQQQRGLGRVGTRTWQEPPAAVPAQAAPVPPPRGAPFAVLRLPRLGEDYEQVVVEGVSPDDLRRGPGHYPGTAMPGEVGNVVISGHRTTYGAPFADLDRLRPGDELLLRSRYADITYRMTRAEIVSPSAVDVIAPVPRRPGAAPTERLLTLTTCNPKYSAKQRLIVYFGQESPRPRPGGVTTR